jgi:hypothetical protein
LILLRLSKVAVREKHEKVSFIDNLLQEVMSKEKKQHDLNKKDPVGRTVGSPRSSNHIILDRMKNACEKESRELSLEIHTLHCLKLLPLLEKLECLTLKIKIQEIPYIDFSDDILKALSRPNQLEIDCEYLSSRSGLPSRLTNLVRLNDITYSVSDRTVQSSGTQQSSPQVTVPKLPYGHLVQGTASYGEEERFGASSTTVSNISSPKSAKKTVYFSFADK